MWIPDMPNVPPQDVPVVIAQANQAQSGNTATVRTFGVCSPVPSNYYSLENVVEPIGSAQDYFGAYENRTVEGPATATIVQQPAHGVLRLVTQADVGTILPSGGDPVDPAAALYFYLPDPNYVGKDSATIQVDFGNGLKVNVKYFFQAISGGMASDWARTYCSKTGVYWKISSTLDANGTSPLTSVEQVAPASSTPDTLTNTSLSAWLNLGQPGGALANLTVPSTGLGSVTSTSLSTGITVNVADLAGAAVGQTTGTNITLDINAAGNGWYIDPNPAANTDFLPTSDPTVWIAKAGRAAAGKSRVSAFW